MTVKMLIDWPDSRDGRKYLAGNLLTTDAATEAGLVAAKVADSNTAGGTAYIAPVDNTSRKLNAYIENGALVDGAGNRFGASNNSRYGGYELSTFYNRPATDFQVVGAGSSADVSTAVTRSGNQTLRVTCNRGSAAPTEINALHTWPNLVSFAGRVGVWMYVPDFTLLTSITLKVSHGSTSYTNGAFQSYIFSDGDHKFNGWHFVGFDKAEFTGVYGTPDWSATIGAVRISINQSSATATDVYLDRTVAGWRAKAKILITQDDGWRNWFDLGLPILDSLGLRTSMGIISAQIDSSATWATSVQLAAAYANGHDLSPHGATNLASLADDAARRTNIATNKAFLLDRGYTRGNDFYMWPNGVFALSDGDYSLIQILRDQGIKAARGTTSLRLTKHAPGHSDMRYLLPVIGVDAAHSVSTITGWIDNAITYGSTGFLMYHEIVASGASGIQRNMSDFIREMEYIAAKRDAGLIDVVGVSDLTAQL